MLCTSTTAASGRAADGLPRLILGLGVDVGHSALDAFGGVVSDAQTPLADPSADKLLQRRDIDRRCRAQAGQKSSYGNATSKKKGPDQAPRRRSRHAVPFQCCDASKQCSQAKHLMQEGHTKGAQAGAGCRI